MVLTSDRRTNAFLIYCYFQFVLGVLVTIISLRHPESEVFLFPSIVINLFIPAILIYVSKYKFDEAVIIIIGINFISTTAYAITSKIEELNALSSMLFLNYLIHAAVLNQVFGKRLSLYYFMVAFMVILLKQLNIFAPYEFEFVYNYSPVEYMVFLTLYLAVLLKYLQMGNEASKEITEKAASK